MPAGRIGSHSFPSLASATVRIISDPGGPVIDYLEWFEAARVAPAGLRHGACLVFTPHGGRPRTAAESQAHSPPRSCTSFIPPMCASGSPATAACPGGLSSSGAASLPLWCRPATPDPPSAPTPRCAGREHRSGRRHHQHVRCRHRRLAATSGARGLSATWCPFTRRMGRRPLAAPRVLFVLYRPGKALCVPYKAIAEAALLSRRPVADAIQHLAGLITLHRGSSASRPSWVSRWCRTVTPTTSTRRAASACSRCSFSRVCPPLPHRPKERRPACEGGASGKLLAIRQLGNKNYRFAHRRAAQAVRRVIPEPA
jgi:hypothetical protein